MRSFYETDEAIKEKQELLSKFSLSPQGDGCVLTFIQYGDIL